jgi:transcriptional regulator with XRE-family HTH domain
LVKPFTDRNSSGILTGRQIRAARGLLGWSLAKLADEAGVSASTIARAEAADAEVPPLLGPNIAALQRALERHGVIFLAASDASGDGVRMRRVRP